MGLGTGTKVAPSGKVKREKQDVQMTFRATGELVDRFQACVLLDARIHGGDVNYNSVMRQLVTQYCNRIESTANEPVAVEAAKVLRSKMEGAVNGNARNVRKKAGK